MKKVIIDKMLFADVIRINSEYDSYCTVLNCSLVKLHDNAELYACVRSNEGIPCELYIANNRDAINKSRVDSAATEWIEAIGYQENTTLFLYHKNVSGDVERTKVLFGTNTPVMAKSLCSTMDRLSNDNNRISVICHTKAYGKAEKEEFQKRSIVDLSTLDSGDVDIIYFDGADKLIEKLLYGGCRELTVFITEMNKYKNITRILDRLSRKAPFSNRITVVGGETYAPKTTSALLVGCASDVSPNAPSNVFFSANYAVSEGISVSVGQNTSELIPSTINYRLKPHTMQYITSIMSELVLHAISVKNYNAKRLFKINAKTLVTETIIKED